MNIEEPLEGKVFKPVKILYGIVAGILASVVAIIFYAIYPFLFEMRFEYFAIGVGFIVGFPISKVSGGKSHILGTIGASLSLVSCMLGDVLSEIAIYSYQNNVPFFGMIASLNFSQIVKILSQSVGFENVLFYLFAMLFGYGTSYAPPMPAFPKTKEEKIKNKKIWRTRFILIGLIFFVIFLFFVVALFQQ